MPARPAAGNKRKRPVVEKEPLTEDESDFSDEYSDEELSYSDDDHSEYDSDLYGSESEYESESEEDEPPRRRHHSSHRSSHRTSSKPSHKKKAVTTRRATSKKPAKRAPKKAKRSTKKGTTKRASKKPLKKVKRATKKGSSGLSVKRLRGRNIPIPMFSAVVEPPKDEAGNVIRPVKQDRKFLLVNENGSATTKAYTAKGPYQAALKAANRLDVTAPDAPTSEIRLREPNSQIMYIFDGKRTKLPADQCIFFHCENDKRQKVTCEEKDKILKANPDAKIIPICHKSSVKRRERVKLNDLQLDDAVATTA
jgi:hypothetical protein